MKTPIIKPLDTITHYGNGGASLVGPKAIDVMRLATLLSGLKFELRCPGMKMSRVGSALKFAKPLTGLKTNDRAKHIERIEMMLAQAHREVLHIDETDQAGEQAAK